MLVLEGSVPNEDDQRRRPLGGMGVDRRDRPADPDQHWIDRLAPRAAAVLALGTCAAYGGIPAMRNNPTGAMGLRDYLGWKWRVAARPAGRQPPGLPGPARQHHRDAAATWCCTSPGWRRAIELDEQGRPRRIFDRTVHESCDRAGLAEQGQFSEQLGDGRCLVKLGCKGPVVKCNVPMRGWVNGDRRLPERRRHLHGVHDAGLPRQVHAVHRSRRRPRGCYARTARFGHGPFVRYLRNRRMQRTFDVEPEWRRRGAALTSGYEAR